MVVEVGECLTCGRTAKGEPGRTYCRQHTPASIGGYPVVPTEPPRFPSLFKADRRTMDGGTMRDPPRVSGEPVPLLCRIRIHSWILMGVGPHDSHEEFQCRRCGDRTVVSCRTRE